MPEDNASRLKSVQNRARLLTGVAAALLLWSAVLVVGAAGAPPMIILALPAIVLGLLIDTAAVLSTFALSEIQGYGKESRILFGLQAGPAILVVCLAVLLFTS